VGDSLESEKHRYQPTQIPTHTPSYGGMIDMYKVVKIHRYNAPLSGFSHNTVSQHKKRDLAEKVLDKCKASDPTGEYAIYTYTSRSTERRSTECGLQMLNNILNGNF